MGDLTRIFLYQWCHKKEKVTPSYDVTISGIKQRPIFSCKVTVSGFNYVGVGNSTNSKKDAMTNAAKDFLAYLLREGKINQSEVTIKFPSVKNENSALSDLPAGGPVTPHEAYSSCVTKKNDKDLVSMAKVRRYDKHAAISEFRKPGELGLQRFGSDLKLDQRSAAINSGGRKITKSNFEVKKNEVMQLCNKISEIKITDSEKDLEIIKSEVMHLCNTSGNLQQFVDKLVAFALKSRRNAHVIALFSAHYVDLSSEGINFRPLLFRKLKDLYLERSKRYLNKEQFFMDVTFLCEVLNHVKIDGNCFKVLVHPVINYFGMLIDGGTQKEIEIFYEQFPKCFNIAKANDSVGFEIIFKKMRKQLVLQSTSATVKTLLLELFERILTDWKPFTPDVKRFYDTLSKPILRICEM